jgi:hypothetical protein
MKIKTGQCCPTIRKDQAAAMRFLCPVARYTLLEQKQNTDTCSEFHSTETADKQK